MNWNNYKNFSEREFRCKHTSKCEMDEGFMDKLQELRTLVGKPFIITSGYRDKAHPIEAKKVRAGEHTLGLAVDIACHGELAYNIIKTALELGFTRIGINQKGNSRYVHIGGADDGFPTKVIWSY